LHHQISFALEAALVNYPIYRKGRTVAKWPEAHLTGDCAGYEVFRPPMPVRPVDLWVIWHKRSTAEPTHGWLRDLMADTRANLDSDGEKV